MNSPMAVIKYEQGQSADKDYFYVEMTPGNPEIEIVEVAFNATQGASFPHTQDNRLIFAIDYRVIAALHATGFQWELEALSKAMEILAKLKPIYLDIDSP